MSHDVVKSEQFYTGIHLENVDVFYWVQLKFRFLEQKKQWNTTYKFQLMVIRIKKKFLPKKIVTEYCETHSNQNVPVLDLHFHEFLACVLISERG